MKRVAAVALTALLVAAAVQADVIYNNYGSGYAYDTSVGWTVSGSASEGGYQESAMAFTPTGSYTLNTITVSVGLVSGTDGFDLAMYSDASGLPGTALESWNNIATTGTFGDPGITETVTDASNLLLTSGTQYWVVATPIASDLWTAWNQNSIGDTGPVAGNTGASWFLQPSGSSPSAFEVTGSTVPEPATCALFALGLVGLLGKRRRR